MFFRAQEKDILEQHLPEEGLWPLLPLGKAFNEPSISSVNEK